MISFPFPKNFLWGTATSAFQIEGGSTQGNKGVSIWDQACKDFPERFSSRATPAVAADFYHRYREDIGMMKELGLSSFRFSISWPRLFPKGRGEINEAGAAFYDSVIDCLLAHQIAPFVDLYHWDLPQALQDEGGFENPQLIEDFGNYAEACFRRYGDRVKLWSTFNEPSVITLSSYEGGAFPPYKTEMKSGLLASHHLLLMHYKAVSIYRSLGLKGKIGAVNAFVPIYPESFKQDDIAAAVRQEDFLCHWWLSAMYLGKYPESSLAEEEIARLMPPRYAETLAEAFKPMDFMGINYYCPGVTAHCLKSPLRSKHVQVFYGQSDYGFSIYPPGLYDALLHITKRYNKPEIYLTENGLGDAQRDNFTSEIEDDDRINFIREHLRELSRAIEAGCNVHGYYYWSHFDDFECERGYDFNFGLLHVDRKTLERTPRKSWAYYKQCIANNRVN